MKIAIGSDKSGFPAKEAIRAYLTEAGVDFDDLGTVTLDEVGNPTFIGHRQSEPVFTATTKVDVSGLKEGGVAGLTAYAAHHNHYDAQVVVRQGKRYVQAKIRIGEMEHIEKEVPLTQSVVYLRITADKQFYHLHYSTDGEHFEQVATIPNEIQEPCQSYVLFGTPVTAQARYVRFVAHPTRGFHFLDEVVVN